MKFSDVRWLYFRLRAMSAGEVVHRFWEQAKRSFDSRRTFQFDDTPIALPVIPGLRDRVRACSDSARRQFRAAADDVRDGRYHFLGRDWPMMGDLPDWHLDPVSGRRWPDRLFCYSVPFRHNSDYGDVKYVWELNRLQHLQFVAAAAVCDDDPELAQVCISHIRSWINANPPFKGINWASGIELALRAISLIIVFSLIPHSNFSSQDRREINATLRAHLFWLARYPSRFSSANNHVVAEATGQFVLGLLMPDCLGARGAEEEGREVLNREACLQILPDGVPAEQSPTYGAFTAELLLTAHAAALATGHEGLGAKALGRLGAFANFVTWITDRSGNIPRIGDDDEGRVIASEESSSEYVNSVVQTIGGTTTRCDLRDAVLSAATPVATPSRENRNGVRTFKQGGYTVVREVAEGKECLLVFDHGPLGYLRIAAHGHADALAIWLHIDGQPVLIDAGTYLYHSGAQWRQYFRSTAAHSTVRLNNRDQSTQSGAFNWSSKAHSKVISLYANLNGFRIEAEHDGYRQRFDAIHRRSIERLSPGKYLIKDALLSDRTQTAFEIGFVVRGDLKIAESHNGWTILDVGEGSVSIECWTEAERLVQRALEQPEVLGWMSTAFRSKSPASRLVLLPSTSTQTVSTVIAVLNERSNRVA